MRPYAGVTGAALHGERWHLGYDPGNPLVHHCFSTLSRIHTKQVFVATTRYDRASPHCRVGRVAESISEEYKNVMTNRFFAQVPRCLLGPIWLLAQTTLRI